MHFLRTFCLHIFAAYVIIQKEQMFAFAKGGGIVHDIWNPWHGCVKCSEGCDHCYMYFLDAQRGKNGAEIYRTKTGFRYPLSRDRAGNYKVKSGEQLRVCMTSDFFLEEADPWRREAWEIMHIRQDVLFFLLTKRPERVEKCLPFNWGDGWDNIFFNVTCENQHRADERIPILHALPFKHKGIMAAPMIGPIEIGHFLDAGQIEQVICGGENYDGARPCDFRWVQSLSRQCRERDITFNFIETGTNFLKDGRRYHMPNKRVQSEMAYKSGVSHKGRPMQVLLTDEFGAEIPENERYRPRFGLQCGNCGSRMTCNGCANCARCTVLDPK